MKFCSKCGESGGGNFCKSCGGKMQEQITDDSGFDAAHDKTYGYLSLGFKDRTVDGVLREMLGMEDGVAKMGVSSYPNCKECGKPIKRDGVQVEAGMYHRTCYKGDVFCSVCGKPLLGEVVTVGGDNYCKQCWSCTECHKKLGDEFVDYKGKPYCHKCAEEIRANAAKRKKKAVPKKTVKKTQRPGRRDVDKMNDGTKCTACGKAMRELGVMCDDQVYHESCFVCAECGRPFPDMRYVTREGKPYHPDCGKKKFAAKCAVCGGALTGGRMYELDGKKIHEKCFKCQDCGTALQGAYVEKNGKYLCDKCATSAPTVTKTRTGAPGQRKGFRIDPITGKKIFN